MLAKLTNYIAALLIISLLVFPSPLLAADDDSFLTPSEENFVLQMSSRIFRARSVLDQYDKLTGDVRKFLKVTTYRELHGPLIKSVSFDGCLSPLTVPDTMADIADLWNTEVCNDFGYISSEVATFVDPKSNVFDFMVGVGLVKLRIGRLRDSISKIEGMIADRVDELTDTRKAAKEAKEELGLDDDFCFIATAAYGTPAAQEIDELRRFRDEYLRKSYLGNEFIKFYYENSPPIAEFISEHEMLRAIVREGFVEPVVKVVELTENCWLE